MAFSSLEIAASFALATRRVRLHYADLGPGYSIGHDAVRGAAYQRRRREKLRAAGVPAGKARSAQAWLLAGPPPLCACGCGCPVETPFARYLRTHHNRTDGYSVLRIVVARALPRGWSTPGNRRRRCDE